MTAERVEISERKDGMTMQRGEKWRCANPECRAEVVVTIASRSGATANLRCGCGTAMKREYEKPTAQMVPLTVDKLPGEAAVEASHGG